MGRFDGKTIVVTGAAQGIGKGVSRRFHEEGANVCMLDLNEKTLEEAKNEIAPNGERISTWKIDVSDSARVNEVFSEIGKKYGGIDVLLNNAGVMGRFLMEEAPDDKIDLMIKVNLIGPMYCSRAAVPYMKNRNANIVNVASILATFPNTGSGVYGATKAGMMVLTRVWAAELAPYGIRVNCYSPGVVETPMSADVIKYRAESKLSQIALRRFGQPDDVYNLVSFLCSDQASYITGQTIGLDGGIWATQKPNGTWNLENK